MKLSNKKNIIVNTGVYMNRTAVSVQELVSSRCYIVCVIQEKAVVISAIVAKKSVTIFAVPYSLMPLMFVSMAVVTATNFL